MKVFAGLLATSILITACLTVKVIGPTEVGVQVFLGDVSNKILRPGVNFVVPFSSVHTISTRQVVEQLKIDAKTKGNVPTTVSVQFNAAIQPQYAKDIYTSVGLDSMDTIINAKFRGVLFNQLKSEFALLTPEEINAQQADLSAKIGARLTEQFKDSDVTATNFSITGIEFPQALTDSYSQKEIARQKQQRALTEQETAKIEAETNRILAQGLTPEILTQHAIEMCEKVKCLLAPNIGSSSQNPLLLQVPTKSK